MVAIIVGIVAIIGIDETDGFSLLLLLISIILILFSKIASNQLKWKAYMLHTNFKRK